MNARMTTPASWQPDPEDPRNSVRYWDGAQWTGHTRPRVPDPDATTVLPAATPAAGAGKRKKWPWIAGAAVVGFVAIGALNSVEAEPVPATVVSTTTTRAAATTTTTTTRTTAITTTSTAPVTSSPVPVAPLVPATKPVVTTTPAYVPPPVTTPAYVPPPVVTTPAYVPPPAPEDTPPAASGPKEVNPGSFCSGGTGVSKKGVPMVCAPGSDGRNRWRSAN
jgi:hypothetical protein